MVINICTLMPLRTTVNYQYRYGTTGIQSLSTLYRDGGLLRFYRGFGFAIIQGPWSRFGDNFANSGTMALLNSNEPTKDLNVGTKTLLASSTASLFRIISTPIDTCKTILQVEGKSGLKKLDRNLEIPADFQEVYLFCGTGHLVQQALPLLDITRGFTYNYLQKYIPEQETVIGNLSKNAFIGFSASAISDTCSNSIEMKRIDRLILNQYHMEHLLKR